MSNFIKDYFSRLRKSDEKTKHRSALTISIVASVILLSVAFLFLKDSLFNIGSKNKPAQEISSNEKNSVISPISSFLKFFKDSGKQFSNIKSAFSDVSTAVKEVSDLKNVINGENASTSEEDSASTTLP
ncbi:MAG: hypothetical protein RI945_272 [Candidatus Parcubacteria bacterium]